MPPPRLALPPPADALRRSYLRLVALSSTLRHLDQLLAVSLASGHYALDPAPATALLLRYASLRAPPGHLLRLFSAFPRPDRFLRNALLRSLPSFRPHLLFPSPDSFSFAFAATALSSSCSRGDAASPSAAARPLHALAVAAGYAADTFVASALAKLYFKLSRVDDARKVFDAVPSPDTVLWNTLLAGLSGSVALEAFVRMVEAGMVWPDATTLASVLPAAADVADIEVGRCVQGFGVKCGLAEHEHVVTGLISLYAKNGDMECARRLFDRMEEPDLVTYNALISGYSVNGMVESSAELFKELAASGCRPNSSTLVAVIPVYSPFGHELLARCLHAFIVKYRFDADALVSTALTTLYCRLNDMESARSIFDAMPEKTMESWNAMISGYAQNGLTEMAVALFQQMQALNVQPNPITISSTLSACAQLGALSLGKWVHEIITKQNLELNVYVMTALIDMYAKCGSIAEARSIFDRMDNKNVVSWNAMISGYGLHGQGAEALKLYKDMLNAHLLPTSSTFLSVLYACSHGGLVEEGRAVFHVMTNVYNISPGIEHCTCMVDLLGRAGKLKEAFELIPKFPKSAIGPGVWGALLGACMVHKDSDLAKVASQKLFELDPANTGYYVLLSNLYTSKKHYSEAALVRQEAKSRKLVKTPGCTLIEIGDKPHVFMAGDCVHPESEAIYSYLEKLTTKMIEAGYRPVTEVALYDVEEEEKEHMVKVHSEKLAIAFGLLSTEPGTEIRIIKNLRVCLDCHDATKFISKVTQRLIVVRDASRFHHFRDGVCSCGDYW
ncbi:pentatricopeptide repeat-containing protein At4g30700 [Phragmites australis]|uniref:pentatricopeptide repeat-containing protein At4g30700 n=1 Tax=Phragmites australis TaxID=29695 RepID=UPI002D77A196|nr:pentatricopeptide repeat-containing protein At4g30700 [Phragmites australis]